MLNTGRSVKWSLLSYTEHDKWKYEHFLIYLLHINKCYWNIPANNNHDRPTTQINTWKWEREKKKSFVIGLHYGRMFPHTHCWQHSHMQHISRNTLDISASPCLMNSFCRNESCIHIKINILQYIIRKIWMCITRCLHIVMLRCTAGQSLPPFGQVSYCDSDTQFFA